MRVDPINSANVSFGKKNKDRDKSFLLPGAIVGAAGGAAYASFSKLKINKENIEESFPVIQEKLPMSETEKDIFDNLKSRIKEKRQYIDEKYGLMNITKETKEVSVQDALKGVVFDPSKSYKKLEDEINWDRGVLEGMKNQPEKAEQIAKTSQSLNDKIAIREFIKDSKENKINASKIKNYFESMITDNAKIKAGKEEVISFVNAFNKRRVGLYSIVGLAAGTIIGSFIKINSNKKEN